MNRATIPAAPVETDDLGRVRCVRCGEFRARVEYGTDGTRSHGMNVRICWGCRGPQDRARRAARRAELRLQAAALPAPVQLPALEPVCGTWPLLADPDTDLPPRLVLAGPWIDPVRGRTR